MAIRQERVEKVQDYGLTEYEARAYLALLELQSATARDVASLSRVPRTKIYQVLDELHAKRLVELIPERPKKYAAVPFEEYLGRFETEYKARLDKIRADREIARRELAPALPREPTRTGTFQVLKGRKNVVAKVEEMLDAAAGEVVHAGSAAAARRFAYHSPVVRDVSARGTRMRFLFPEGDGNEAALDQLAAFGEVRCSAEASGAAVLVIDRRQAVVWHPVPDDGHVFQGEDVAIWTDDEAVVRDILAGLDARWGACAPRRKEA